MIPRRFPGRVVELVMDGAYASKAWRGLPDRVTVTTRMRATATFKPVTVTSPDGRERTVHVHELVCL